MVHRLRDLASHGHFTLAHFNLYEFGVRLDWRGTYTAIEGPFKSPSYCIASIHGCMFFSLKLRLKGAK